MTDKEIHERDIDWLESSHGKYPPGRGCSLWINTFTNIHLPLF